MPTASLAAYLSRRKIRTKTTGIRYYGHNHLFDEADLAVELNVLRGGRASDWVVRELGTNNFTSVIELENPTIADDMISLEMEVEVTAVRRPSRPMYYVSIGTVAAQIKSLNVAVNFGSYVPGQAFCGHGPRDDFPTDVVEMRKVPIDASRKAAYRPDTPYQTGHAYGIWWEPTNA